MAKKNLMKTNDFYFNSKAHSEADKSFKKHLKEVDKRTDAYLRSIGVEPATNPALKRTKKAGK